MEFTRIFDFLKHQLNNVPLEKSLSSKYNSKWVSISTKEFFDQSHKISQALIELGIKANDKIALISSTNRSEWSIIDMGILQIGAINVPLYPTITSKDYEYILNHSECKYCFVSDIEVLNKIKPIEGKVKSLKEIFSFDQIRNCKNWEELLDLGKNYDLNKINKIKNEINSDNLATIIYTSGTTGVPKGVMLSHGNLVSNVISASKRLGLQPNKNHKALSFLPLCHIYERTQLYGYIFNSFEVYFAESLETIGDNLKEVNPHVITAVPRLLEKVFDKFYEKGDELNGFKKKLFYWAIKIGLNYNPFKNESLINKLKLKIAYKLILSKWKEALGGNLIHIQSGSAALQPRLIKIFSAAKMIIVEGYGLTETSPAITINEKSKTGFKIGSVGKVIDDVEIKIASDGEILCKGPNIMLGYFKNKELTKQSMTGEYFHTGDIGEIDSNGFLTITDRKKEMFKTSGGKYIAPQVIESLIKQSSFIEQIAVIGENQKMPSAIIQPNFEFCLQWLNEKGISCENNLIKICNQEKLINQIQKEIDIYNESFAQWEKIKKFKLTPEVWSIEKEHLTPTMKVKRKMIKEKFKNLVDEIYN